MSENVWVMRLAYRMRTIPPPWALGIVWCAWWVVLLGLCSYVLVSGQTPGAASLYQSLTLAPALPAGITAGLAGAAAMAEGGELRHTFASAGVRDWIDGVVVSLAGWLVATLSAVAAARICLPVPWGDALGCALVPAALFAALGFCAGALSARAWAGSSAVPVVWTMALWFGPDWGGADPFGSAPLGVFIPGRLALLSAIALALLGISLVDARCPDRLGALARTFRQPRKGGWGTSPLPIALVSMAPVLIVCGLHPHLRAVPGVPLDLPAAGAARIVGGVSATVTSNRQGWILTEAIPVDVPALTTSVSVDAGSGDVARAWLDGRRLTVTPPVAAGSPATLSGRALGWSRSSVATLRLQVVAPTISPRLFTPVVDRSGADSVQVRWKSGLAVPLQPASPCGAFECWAGA